ncbi:MarR family winged helix-turn-helix transcriptional regulator [Pseudoxanthomonas koreensis]|uniref:MarR family winged helix-turn-helix transcriptional regulator n=1 Tax=Pseudoxanthomonas koreensis TaxID=266061 RepID=UPI001390E4AF|nr:MarR family winged helix-turn-helix transcriptional regulator [Pseudoxanthomonas koreensis]KAF1693409.1 MarR family transcriptional regulator [Pseudoxanthomonas koreensis]
MSATRASPSGQALTDLILTMFRVNNRTLNWGDRLVAPLGLTSARWQVLGAIAFADQPRPVAWLARDLGASRQNVQRIVNDLLRDGMVEFQPNPHHRRAQLVVMTKKGRRTYETVVDMYYSKVDDLAEGLSGNDIRIAHHVLRTLQGRLEKSEGEG